MKRQQRNTLILGLSVLAAASQGACSSDHLLVGENPDAARTGSGGAVGENPDSGAGGVGGTGGGPSGTGGATITRSERPLAISGREALTRMAAVIWNAAPDADLLSQDSLGHFKTVEDLYGPARQMLADPRAVTGVGNFYRWWLSLDGLATVMKDPTLFPTFDAQMGTDMGNEVETFGVNVTLSLNGTYQSLMTAPFSFINARLADVYGVAGVTGDNLQQVSLNPQERAGLLTLAGMQALSTHADRNSPPVRGKNIRQQILCQQIPAPPANVPALIPASTGGTLRQRLASTENSPACTACHGLLDPLGLAFEAFDAIGHARTIDNGAPVDVSGLTFSDNSTVPSATYNGPIELANLIAHDDVAEQCMARQWLAFALQKANVASLPQNNSLIDNSMAQIMAPFRAASFNLKELIADVLLTDAFLAPTQP